MIEVYYTPNHHTKGLLYIKNDRATWSDLLNVTEWIELKIEPNYKYTKLFEIEE